jgi:two-component system, LytTR family, sensor histidine kinase AlgZ
MSRAITLSPHTFNHPENITGDWLNRINTFLYNDFIFSPKYKIQRHVIYWTFHVFVWAVFWMIMGSGNVSYFRNLFNMILWVPVFILFSYPMVYGAVPHLLLKGKVWQFAILGFLWAMVGLVINFYFRTYIYVPIQEWIGFEYIPPKGQQPHSYLCMTTSAASPMIIKFFKLWTIKQKDWMRVQQEKISADLQLLKAQVHPHFFFNTLHNIYEFSLSQSPKTPELILKLSSLLSYMLYDCKAAEVRLEKEIEMMKHYIDLEHERCMNKMDVSWSVEGDVKDLYLAPLLMLPFFENAFKHGISGQIEKSWLSADISVRKNRLLLKVVNSKNEFLQYNGNGAGLNNVKKRLELLYPERHELRIHDEGNFFVVSLIVQLGADELLTMHPSKLRVISKTMPA